MTIPVAVWIMFLLQIPTCHSIWCYQCFTNDSRDLCATSPPSALEDCPKSFCLKTVIYHPNGSLMSLSRTCTDIDMPSYCSSGQMEEDTSNFQHTNNRPVDGRKRDIKLCTYFCGSNYCNAAVRLRAGCLLPLVVVTALWALSSSSSIAPFRLPN
ncbi:hypothetical protein BV898_15132 [Hypsibius exemplaris]|uniref:Protein sleepless n=1 Tax=Hypsibius exemplaris TaxID=2072580 RepID=A0A9X6NHA3_HYPEX|nr:hypothetical protein BV898_15132 [Hypsibius exemplaris]